MSDADDAFDPAPKRLRLPARLDGPTAASPAEDLMAAQGRDLILEADDVRHAGAAGLQVLLAARRSWAVDGQVLGCAAPSRRFAEGLARLGASVEALTVGGSR